MRVRELTAYIVRLPLRRRIRHASHVRVSTDNLIVRCTLADGTEGYGEGVPRDYVTGETAESALALLKQTDWPGQLAGAAGDCADFPAAVALADALQLAPVPGDQRGCAGNAARCAVELALLDAFGRHFHQPLSTLTKLIAPALYRPQARVRYGFAITGARGLKLVLAALVARFYRFADVKLKVGIAGYDDVKRLRWLRRLVRRSVRVRLDANEAYDASEAADRIAQLEPFGIDWIEQPLPHEQAEALARLRRQVRVPIMLDESVCSLRDAQQAVAGQWCDLVNVRLSKCGGFIPSLRLMQYVTAEGLGCQLGCQVGESALLSAAGRHFACSVAGLRAIEGSYDRHLLYHSLSRRDLTFGYGGWAGALTGGGLGVEVDTLTLNRLTLRKELLFA
jgi:L-alanine-DL-glutamate epimerase-like enolase superfamily enzyme